MQTAAMPMILLLRTLILCLALALPAIAAMAACCGPGLAAAMYAASAAAMPSFS